MAVASITNGVSATASRGFRVLGSTWLLNNKHEFVVIIHFSLLNSNYNYS